MSRWLAGRSPSGGQRRQQNKSHEGVNIEEAERVRNDRMNMKARERGQRYWRKCDRERPGSRKRR
jgi:hypothetical protein